MPYKTREPVSEKQMLKARYQGHHTICQTLRDIYILTKNDEIKYKCRVGMAMAKAMHEKLKEYKKMFDEKGAE
jgi:CRISPR/Cas system-associated exonuclease Cas4 (RecB family)